MATKKQKRAAAEAKHNRFMEELRRTGLEAQRKDREHRERKETEAWRENHDKRHTTPDKLIKECPICRTILASQKRERDLMERNIAS